jgi:hypothetical protein
MVLTGSPSCGINASIGLLAGTSNRDGPLTGSVISRNPGIIVRVPEIDGHHLLRE